MGRRAVFLDRDGVLNRAVVLNGRPFPPATVESFELMNGVREGLTHLREAGFLLVVVTNQPDIGRGTQDASVVEAMHGKLRELVQLDDIRVCPHDDRDQCSCRKPLPGMILDAARDFGVDLAASYLVGDRWRDIAAGAAAGLRTVLIDYNYREEMRAIPWRKAKTFAEAVACILVDAQDH